jgi:hypothetical protein
LRGHGDSHSIEAVSLCSTWRLGHAIASATPSATSVGDGNPRQLDVACSVGELSRRHGNVPRERKEKNSEECVRAQRNAESAAESRLTMLEEMEHSDAKLDASVTQLVCPSGGRRLARGITEV